MHYLQSLKAFDFILILNVLVGVAFYIKLNSTPVKLLVILLVVTMFVELSTPLRFFSFKNGNYMLYNIFTPVELIIYASIYYTAFETKNKKRFIVACTAIALLFITINFLLIQTPRQFNSYSYVVSFICITLFSFVCLRQLYSSEESLNFYTQPMFWISIGVLFFYPIAIFSTGPITEVFHYSESLSTQLSRINSVTNSITYSIYLVAIVIEARKQRNSS